MKVVKGLNYVPVMTPSVIKTTVLQVKEMISRLGLSYSARYAPSTPFLLFEPNA
jgi:hypothetical protein